LFRVAILEQLILNGITFLLPQEKLISDDILDLNEVSEILSKATIKRYARENLLTNVGEGDELKFKKDEVMRYLEFSKHLG